MRKENNDNNNEKKPQDPKNLSVQPFCSFFLLCNCQNTEGNLLFFLMSNSFFSFLFFFK